MAVFYDATGKGQAGQTTFLPLLDYKLNWQHTASGGSDIAVVVALSYAVGGTTELDDLTRTVKYEGMQLDSLGVVLWNNAEGGWTELFGGVGVPAGKANVTVDVRKSGLIAAPSWILRGNSVSYNGVGSFGTVVETYGSGTSLSMSATGASSTMVAQAYGAKAGLSAYNRTQRYLGNSPGSALAMGDMDGTGSSASFTATKAASGEWGGMSVVLIPTDIYGAAITADADTATSASGRRTARPGTNRRTVFTPAAEA